MTPARAWEIELLSRRVFLRRAGLTTAMLAWSPLSLAGCADGSRAPGSQAKAVADRSIGIDYASYYPPFADLHRLVIDHSRTRRAAVTFSNDRAGGRQQAETLDKWTTPKGGFRVLAIAPFDAAAAATAVRRARANDIDVVSFLVPIEGQSAGIVVDPVASARMLAKHASEWVRGTAEGGTDVLLVRPPTNPAVVDPFAQLAPRAEAALTTELSRLAPRLRMLAATEAQSSGDARLAVLRALEQFPRARMVLAWNDATASGAADALSARHGSATRRALYSGGLAAPAVSTPAILRQIKANTPLRCIVSPRLRDVAEALVDVPLGILRGEAPKDLRVAAHALDADSAELRRFERDYAAAGHLG